MPRMQYISSLRTMIGIRGLVVELTVNDLDVYGRWI